MKSITIKVDGLFYSSTYMRMRNLAYLYLSNFRNTAEEIIFAMKKLITILLTLGLLCCLIACSQNESGKPVFPDATAGAGAGNNNANQEVFQGNDSVPADSYMAKITMLINPVFDIFLDANGNVIAVDFGNSDAREVGKGLSFKGLTAQETIQKLLQASNEKGYFAEEARPVEIQISGTALPDEMAAALRLSMVQTVVTFTDEENLSLELSLKMWESTTVKTVIRDGEADELPSEVAFDADAKTTSETVSLSNGGTCTKTYNSQYQLISEKSSFPGLWTVEKCFENGVLTKEIMDTEQGDHTVTHYWANGTVKATDHQGADGRVFNCEYNENGNQIWAYEVMPDGYAMESEYRDDGTLSKTVDILPDGKVERTFDERGNVILELVDRADSKSRNEYNYSGDTLISTVIYMQDGSSLTKLVMEYSGASRTDTAYYSNGGKIIRKYNAFGALLSEAFYDAAGNAYDNEDDWTAHTNN